MTSPRTHSQEMAKQGLELCLSLLCWAVGTPPGDPPTHVLPPKHSAPAQAHLHIQPQRQHRTHRATARENSKHASASPRSLTQEPPPGAHCPQMFTETPSKSHTHHPQIRTPCTNSTRIHTTHAAHIPSVSTCDGHTVYIYIYISHANAVVANIPPTLPTATLHVPYRQQRLRTPRLPNLHTRTGHGVQVSMLCVCVDMHTRGHTCTRSWEQGRDLELLVALIFSEADHTRARWLPLGCFPGV